MISFFGLPAAGPAFFLSAWVLMIFAGITGPDVGIHPFGYGTALVVTIGLWLCIAPAAGAIARSPAGRNTSRHAKSRREQASA
ncbi:MAG TPA: hypothetical protein VGR90_06860 [Acidimicrobiales bacterium]|nr:hypothetical protein [Acidimicrobiales bacterium]